MADMYRAMGRFRDGSGEHIVALAGVRTDRLAAETDRAAALGAEETWVEEATWTRVDAEGFKFAGFSGPHPSLVVVCGECGSPAGSYCNDEAGQPQDRPHDSRREAASALRRTDDAAEGGEQPQ